MTKKSESATEAAKRAGGLDKVPKPIEHDLMDSVAIGAFSLFAKTWSKRVEAEIEAGKVNPNQSEFRDFAFCLRNFENAKLEFTTKRANKSRRDNLAKAYSELKAVAEKLPIETRLSPKD